MLSPWPCWTYRCKAEHLHATLRPFDIVWKFLWGLDVIPSLIHQIRMSVEVSTTLNPLESSVADDLGSLLGMMQRQLIIDCWYVSSGQPYPSFHCRVTSLNTRHNNKLVTRNVLRSHLHKFLCAVAKFLWNTRWLPRVKLSASFSKVHQTAAVWPYCIGRTKSP